MKKLLYILLLLLPLLLSARDLEGDGARSVSTEQELYEAQDEYDAYTLLVLARLQQFHDDMSDLSTHIATASTAGLTDLQRSFNSLDVRWNTYCTAQQGYIADNENMLAIVAQYQQLKQMVSDSIDHCRARFKAVDDFNDAMQYMQDKFPEYDRIQRRCDKLSATQQTANELDKAKAAEQLLFADITAKYKEAKDAVDLNPVLKKDELALDNIYLELSTRSENVQATVYRSFMDRIKDYLLGFAAVAIIMLFVTTMVNKVQSAKQLRESMKKLKEQYIKEGQDDIPSI